MDNLFSIFFAIVAAIGLSTIMVAIFHPAPSKTRLVRALCWPGIRPTDHVVLPLGSLLFFTGAAVASSTWLPFGARIALVLVGVVSAIVFWRRRNEA